MFRSVPSHDLGTEVRCSINVLGYIVTVAEHQRAREEFGRCPGIETPASSTI
ncbi:MAG: hypothetical protein NTX48_01350 [Planctomycetales bacterium]|nr:hypothetical protein [Planctomycetales bacterium]